MLLRNGALSGGSTGQLPAEARPLFEEGATLVFRRWTALGLAVEGQWGGASSVEKADNIWADTMDWFYKNKGVRSHSGKLNASTTSLTIMYIAIHPIALLPLCTHAECCTHAQYCLLLGTAYTIAYVELIGVFVHGGRALLG